jgi:hypothetical protein
MSPMLSHESSGGGSCCTSDYEYANLNDIMCDGVLLSGVRCGHQDCDTREEPYMTQGVSLKTWHRAIRQHRKLGLTSLLYQGARSDLDPIMLLQRIIEVRIPINI